MIQDISRSTEIICSKEENQITSVIFLCTNFDVIHGKLYLVHVQSVTYIYLVRKVVCLFCLFSIVELLQIKLFTILGELGVSSWYHGKAPNEWDFLEVISCFLELW
jgi:hypothetical protein